MTLVEFIQQQVRMTLWAEPEAMAELSEEAFNWQPPGRANSIAVTLLHAFGIEDAFIQRKLLDMPTIWESGGWAAQIGVAETPDLGNGWEVGEKRPFSRSLIMAYGQAVQAATNSYLETLTPELLAQPMEMGGRPGTVAALLSILVIHNVSHGGEIAALKGCLGHQGQPV